MRKTGMTQYELADHFKCTQECISKTLKRYREKGY